METDARRGWQQLLLVFALVAGVLGMHALVVADHDMQNGVGQTAHHATAELATWPIAVAEMAADALTPAPSGHGTPAGPTDVAHGLLHLCLAVLAAIALLLLGLFPVAAPAAVLSRLLLRGPAPAPARPPPRSAVRLALLCVLRN